MEERKIIKFGNSSYIVTLPFEWIKRHNLTKGDKVNLIENGSSLIFSLNTKVEEKKAEIKIDNKPLKFFNRELISYYLKNYKYIKISGKNIVEKLEEIKMFKEKLSSVEIVEINTNYILLKDLTNAADLDVVSLIKEIVDMEKIFFDELVKEGAGNKYYMISSLDSNINKLTFLAFKGLNYNLDSWNNPKQAKSAIHYWRIVSSLETVGDIIKRIARYMKDLDDEKSLHVNKVLKNIKFYFEFVTSLLNEGVSLENNLKLYYDKKQSLLREFEDLRNDLKDDINMYLVLTQLFKDVLGHLDSVLLSVIDLNTH